MTILMELLLIKFPLAYFLDIKNVLLKVLSNFSY